MHCILSQILVSLILNHPVSIKSSVQRVSCFVSSSIPWSKFRVQKCSFKKTKIQKCARPPNAWSCAYPYNIYDSSSFFEFSDNICQFSFAKLPIKIGSNLRPDQKPVCFLEFIQTCTVRCNITYFIIPKNSFLVEQLFFSRHWTICTLLVWMRIVQ